MSYDSLRKKVFGVQGFRDLFKDVDLLEPKEVDLTYEMAFGEENTSVSTSPTKTTKEKPIVRVKQWFRNLSRGVNPIAFTIQASQYIWSRIRIFIVLMSVTAELLSNAFDFVKRSIIRRMFWGRGQLFKYSIVVVSGFLLMVILSSQNYRTDIISEVESYSTEAVYAAEPIVGADVLVQNATTNTQTPQDRGRLDTVSYTVRSGDTLSTIASFYEISMDTLKWANGLTEGHVIRPGMVLRIPQGNGVIVKVAKGDTVKSLAKKYSASEQNIVDENWIDPPFDLTVGTELFIPDGKMPVVAVKKTTYSGIINTKGSSLSTVYGTPDPNVGRFLGWPVAGGRGNLTQCYRGAAHYGVDIADGSAPDLVAAADGVVQFAGCHSGSCPKLIPGKIVTGGRLQAWAVEINHGNGYTSFYAHMNAIYVVSGQTVKKGQVIGQMGKSGRATGIHVHFELWKGKKWSRVNPTLYMQRRICGN